MATPSPPQPAVQRLRLRVRGVVQGVGFRPHVYRLASGLGLRGWVRNTGDGVTIEAEGPPDALEALRLRLEPEAPPRAALQGLEAAWLEPAGLGPFTILESAAPVDGTGALVPPDIATCPDCLRELFHESDRRHGYPFTNCTNCGPRLTIIEGLPYDRPATTMRAFAMCADCAREYADPADRRFHAQPNACPVCGPRLSLAGGTDATAADPLEAAARALEAGLIVAMRGVGGFHLLCDARSPAAVARLRGRKRREEKPFAVMFPGMEQVRAACGVSPLEERMLASPEAPIVLLMRRRDVEPGLLADGVAPGNPQVGAMLPYSPLHHLLLRRTGFPLVATSGNLSDEPICTGNGEALERLADIADLFLLHDRPIARPVDDSVVRVAAGRELVLRRARGFAPLPLPVRGPLPCVLAFGAHLKNTVALSRGRGIFTSQHIGDLDSPQSRAAHAAAARDLPRLLGAVPVAVACDMHPDYASTQLARESSLPRVEVQHHHAHVAACMAENELEGEVLGVSWDGTGFGLDATVWGGEFLLATAGSFRRVATLHPFRLPGGDAAVREPRRAAIGLLHAALGDDAFALHDAPCLDGFAPAQTDLLRQQLARGLNAPVTTSAGRLFDAVASLAGLRQVTAFEGQSAMALEFAAGGRAAPPEQAYRIDLRETRAPTAHNVWDPRATPPDGDADTPLIELDWRPLLDALLADVRAGAGSDAISARFHAALAGAIVAVAHKCAVPRVVLSGGCFQNRLLLETAVERLAADGFTPFRHQRIPPNDGGIAPGQAFVAAGIIAKE